MYITQQPIKGLQSIRTIGTLLTILTLPMTAIAEETDDTAHLQALIDSSDPGQQLVLDRIYRISRQLIVPKPVFITGGGTIVASPDIRQFIGTKGTDALLRFTETADGAVLDDITVDLALQGRTAVRIEARMTVRNVRIENYHKKTKADNLHHSKSESGFRVSATGVRMIDIQCDNMTTAVDDSVPRCVTVHGDASDVRIDGIKASNVNGGVTIGRSDSVSVTNFEFVRISDNGFYILPGSTNFSASNGTMRDVSEAAVFKGTDSSIQDIEIHNHEQAFGLDNADGVSLSAVTVTHDSSLRTTPAFLRTRRGNKHSTNIRIVDVDAQLRQGSSLLNLAAGSVTDFRLERSKFVIEVADNSSAPWLIRQNQGDLPILEDNVFDYVGAGATSIKSVQFKSPAPCDGFVETFEQTNTVRTNGAAQGISLRQVSR